MKISLQESPALPRVQAGGDKHPAGPCGRPAAGANSHQGSLRCSRVKTEDCAPLLLLLLLLHAAPFLSDPDSRDQICRPQRCETGENSLDKQRARKNPPVLFFLPSGLRSVSLAFGQKAIRPASHDSPSRQQQQQLHHSWTHKSRNHLVSRGARVSWPGPGQSDGVGAFAGASARAAAAPRGPRTTRVTLTPARMYADSGSWTQLLCGVQLLCPCPCRAQVPSACCLSYVLLDCRCSSTTACH